VHPLWAYLPSFLFALRRLFLARFHLATTREWTFQFLNLSRFQNRSCKELPTSYESKVSNYYGVAKCRGVLNLSLSLGSLEQSVNQKRLSCFQYKRLLLGIRIGCCRLRDHFVNWNSYLALSRHKFAFWLLCNCFGFQTTWERWLWGKNCRLF